MAVLACLVIVMMKPYDYHDTDDGIDYKIDRYTVLLLVMLLVLAFLVPCSLCIRSSVSFWFLRFVAVPPFKLESTYSLLYIPTQKKLGTASNLRKTSKRRSREAWKWMKLSPAEAEVWQSMWTCELTILYVRTT